MKTRHLILALSLCALSQSASAEIQLRVDGKIVEKTVESLQFNPSMGEVIIIFDDGTTMTCNTNQLVIGADYRGDANNDGQTTETDAATIQKYLLEKRVSSFSKRGANTNVDSKISVADITGVINIINNKEQ